MITKDEVLDLMMKEMNESSEFKKEFKKVDFLENDVLNSRKIEENYIESYTYYIENEKSKYIDVVQVDSVGGCEGDGEYKSKTFEIIIKESNEKVYIEFAGYHDSWDSGYYHDSYLVKPVEVTKIEYQKI